MTLIGFLHYRSDPNRVRKANAFASVAYAEGVDFVYMTAGKVNFEEHSVVGSVYEKGRWVERTVRFPDVIYNEAASNSEHSQEVIDRLREMIPFTSHSVGDKVTVYEKIEQGGQFSQFLIPYREVRHSSEVECFLELHPLTILKPVWGHHGDGILFLEKLSDGYRITENEKTMTCSRIELLELLEQRLNSGVHLVQKFIASKTIAGSSYDFRLHVQKNGNGKWDVLSIYPRIAKDGSVVANISNGGYTKYLIPFLKQEFGDQYYDVKRTLEHFSLVLAAHLDEVYQEPFDELGIDVGLDENQKIWLFEVNWKPRTPVMFCLELDVVRNSILYARYLGQREQLKKDSVKTS